MTRVCNHYIYNDVQYGMHTKCLAFLVFQGQVFSDLVETLESELNTTLSEEDKQFIKENKQWMEATLNTTHTDEDEQFIKENEQSMEENQTMSARGLTNLGIYLNIICEI